MSLTRLKPEGHIAILLLLHCKEELETAYLKVNK